MVTLLSLDAIGISIKELYLFLILKVPFYFQFFFEVSSQLSVSVWIICFDYCLIYRFNFSFIADPGVEPRSPALQADFLPSKPPGKPSLIHQFISVQSLSVLLFVIPWTAAPYRSPTPRVYPNSCPLSRWCHLTISSSVIPFSSCLQSFPTSGSFQMSQLFASGGQSIEVSASASVLPMNTQDWSPLGWTGWISLQSKGFSRVFSNTTVQKHQFFSTQLSLSIPCIPQIVVPSR